MPFTVVGDTPLSLRVIANLMCSQLDQRLYPDFVIGNYKEDHARRLKPRGTLWRGNILGTNPVLESLRVSVHSGTVRLQSMSHNLIVATIEMTVPPYGVAAHVDWGPLPKEIHAKSPNRIHASFQLNLDTATFAVQHFDMARIELNGLEPLDAAATVAAIALPVFSGFLAIASIVTRNPAWIRPSHAVNDQVNTLARQHILSALNGIAEGGFAGAGVRGGGLYCWFFQLVQRASAVFG